MAFAIHEREKRARLEARAKPYFVRLTNQLHLGYRKGKSVSRWVVRTRHDGRYRTQTIKDAEPDDRLAPDGVNILSFQQVVNRVMTKSKSKVGCSFCGKERTQVAKLVAGPGVFICDECIALCQVYMDHPSEEGKKLLIDDGKPIIKDGQPVFVPLSEEEQKLRDELMQE